MATSKSGQSRQGKRSPSTTSPTSYSVQPARFGPLAEAPPVETGENGHTMVLLMDVPLRVTVELGRARLPIKEVLSLGPGSIVELDKLAGEPVDVRVNDRLIARGEVVVVDEKFGVRVTEIVRASEHEEEAGAVEEG